MPYKLSQDKKNNVKLLIEKKESTKYIMQTTGVSRATIKRMKNQFDPNRIKIIAGRSSIVKDYTKKIIHFKLKCGYLRTARDTQTYLNQIGYPIGYTGTRRIIKSLGFKTYFKKNKVLLKIDHVKARLKWAIKHRDWTVDDWSKVIFSDETKINRWGSDGAEYTYKIPGDIDRPHNFKTVLKHGGGSLMMWEFRYLN
jgi:transposase